MDPFVISRRRCNQSVAGIEEGGLQVLCPEVSAEKSMLRVLNPVDSPYALIFVLPLRNCVHNSPARVGLRDRQETGELHRCGIEPDSRCKYIAHVADVSGCV